MADTPSKPRRRWFTYSLRTLFAVVTVFACWLGYQLNWIRQRNAVRAANRVVDGPPGPIYPGSSSEWACNAPWSLRILGEYGAAGVHVKKNASDSEIERIRKLFPEATNVTRGGTL